VGYILTIDGERIYIAGDTDITNENRQVKSGGDSDETKPGIKCPQGRGKGGSLFWGQDSFR